MKNKKGFTLAEILVVMAIIGVLSVILIPTLFRSKPNQEMIMLKKTYYLIGRAVVELINDDDFYPDPGDNTKDGFANTVLVNYHGKEYGGDDATKANAKFCNLFATRMNLASDVNCTENRSLDDGSFTTTDGVIWLIPMTNFNRGKAAGTDVNITTKISVDVNGTKGPNCKPTASNCSAPDRFDIKIDRYGKITVDDDKTREYLSSSDITK